MLPFGITICAAQSFARPKSSFSFKVKTFWEGYKILKKDHLLWRYCVNVKTIFLAFSENFNFNKKLNPYVSFMVSEWR